MISRRSLLAFIGLSAAPKVPLPVTEEAPDWAAEAVAYLRMPRELSLSSLITPNVFAQYMSLSEYSASVGFVKQCREVGLLNDRSGDSGLMDNMAAMGQQ